MALRRQLSWLQIILVELELDVVEAVAVIENGGDRVLEVIMEEVEVTGWLLRAILMLVVLVVVSVATVSVAVAIVVAIVMAVVFCVTLGFVVIKVR